MCTSVINSNGIHTFGFQSPTSDRSIVPIQNSKFVNSFDGFVIGPDKEETRCGDTFDANCSIRRKLRLLSSKKMPKRMKEIIIQLTKQLESDSRSNNITNFYFFKFFLFAAIF